METRRNIVLTFMIKSVYIIFALVLFNSVSFSQGRENETLSQIRTLFDKHDTLTMHMKSSGCFHQDVEELVFLRDTNMVFVKNIHNDEIREVSIPYSYFNDSIMPLVHKTYLINQENCYSTTSIYYALYLNSKVITIRNKEWKLVGSRKYRDDCCYVEDCGDPHLLSALYEIVEEKIARKKKGKTTQVKDKKTIPHLDSE